jgi:hypothetical protein
MIGGIVDNLPTTTCRKFHLEDRMWIDIASIGFYGTLTSPASINIDDYLYVFDTYSETQSIHKYSVLYDIWENITFRTNDFMIPRSLNSSVYRYS